MSPETLQYRYPGIRSFERDEQDLFFGRSEEIRSLYAQVKVLDLVVLFAKSGIGKSSLINAGLVPLLDLEPLVPLKMRFQDVSISPVQTVRNALEPFVDTGLLQQHAGPANNGWWETLRACRFERYGEKAIPVLLMDQFEEFFEHSPESQRDFVLDLADLMSGRLPNRVRDHLLDIPVAERTDADMDWHQSPPVKVLIAIRSDRLSLLDNLSVEIPLILNNRMHLRPLQRRQASEAVEAPAALNAPGFYTPPFRYEEGTLNLVLDELTNKNEEIESFQLQLVCQHLERQLQRRIRKNPDSPLLIDESFLRESNDIQTILNDYYEWAINTLPETDRACARDFIETGLIVGGRRVGVTEGVEKERYGVGQDLLSALIDSRLVRVENTHLGRSYEISHDTLVPAILQSYEKRRRLEEAEAEEKARKEREQQMAEELTRRTQAERLEHERRLRLRTRGFAAIASLLAVVALSAFALARQENKVAKAKNALAEQSLREYEAEKRRREEAELTLHETKVKIYLNANQPLMAQREIQMARQIDSTKSWIADQSQRAEEQLHKLQKFNPK